MNRTELAEALKMYSDADAEEQTAIAEKILNENDQLYTAAKEFVSGVPNGAANWKEAHSALKQKYVNRFLSGSSTEESEEPKPDENEPMKYSALFGAK